MCPTCYYLSPPLYVAASTTSLFNLLSALPPIIGQATRSPPFELL